MKMLIAIAIWIFVAAALVAFIRGAGNTNTRGRR
jgi:hypothetical protein